MYDGILDEEEERFDAAIEAQNGSQAGIAESADGKDDERAEGIAWQFGSVTLKNLPPHVGRRCRYAESFMDLLIYFMNLAKRRGDVERLKELNSIYRAAL